MNTRLPTANLEKPRVLAQYYWGVKSAQRSGSSRECSADFRDKQKNYLYVDKELSTECPRSPCLFGRTVDFLFHIQVQVIRTRAYHRHVLKKKVHTARSVVFSRLCLILQITWVDVVLVHFMRHITFGQAIPTDLGGPRRMP